MDNRSILLQCAKELFYAKGYDAVGVQEIVDRAGLTKPTLYYYFGSKLGLLETLLEIQFEELRRMKALICPDADIRQTLYSIAKAYCGIYEKDRQLYMLTMALFYSARENEAYHVVKPAVKEFYEMIVGVFEAASDQLGNMNGRQSQFAIGFIGTLSHYLLLHGETDPQMKERISEEQIVSLVNQFMHGIFS